MLTREENELLSRVGPGTPMGELMREYWMPAVRAAALEADGAPRRVRLMGENFVAFRATDGRVGFFDEGCPHRCTSLALARNEDNALRCIFHGWKIDVSGKVVEVPSEPPERRAEFAAKVRVRHYPAREAGGVIWVYLGKREQPPKFVDFEFNTLPASHVAVYPAVLHSNWLQGLETTIDSSHLGIMHSSWMRRPSGQTRLASADTGPTYDYLMQPYGFRETALRDLGDGTIYHRIREVVAPFYSFIPQDSFQPRLAICLIPIDDEWHTQWYFRYELNKPFDEETRQSQMGATGVPDNIAADTGGAEKLWGQSRKAMKEGHFTGLKTLNYEDFAVAESPGPIIDRTREYLGSSDSTLIRFRRMMIGAARAHQEGKPAIGLAQDVAYDKIRAITVRVEKAFDWKRVDPLSPPQSLPLLR